MTKMMRMSAHSGYFPSSGLASGLLIFGSSVIYRVLCVCRSQELLSLYYIIVPFGNQGVFFGQLL